MDSQQVVQPVNISADAGIRKESIATRAGHRLGLFVKQYGQPIMCALLVVCVCALFIHIGFSMCHDELDGSLLSAAAAYANSARHTMCKGGNGCGRRCPHISQDDPRIAIGHCADGIEEMYNVVRSGISDERVETGVFVTGLSPADAETANGKVAPIQATCDNVLMNLSTLLSKAKNLDATFANSSNVTSQVVNAKNRAAALHAAAKINNNVFVAGAVYIQSFIKNMHISKISQIDQHRITNYDMLASECTSFTASIAASYALLTPLISNDASSAYAKAVVSLLNDSADSESIVTVMATLMNTAKSARDTVNTMMAKFEMVDDIAQKCVIKDTFSNDLPGKPSSDMVSALISTGDYSSALIKTALEPEIVTNHKKFAKERSAFDSGGGVPAVRDDDNDVVPWVGLFGRPTYRRSDGSSAETSTIALKSIPSDIPDSLMRAKVPKLSLS
jgi:hypothetical protein